MVHKYNISYKKYIVGIQMEIGDNKNEITLQK